MLSREEFIRMSLELNLFFQRIMKEHMFFIETSLTPAETTLITEANILKKSFEELLSETVILANGAVGNEVLKSNEIVTSFTLDAEEISSKLTGASINTDITKAELKLMSDPRFIYTEWLERAMCNLNMRSMNLLGEVIAFKEKLLDSVLKCKVFIVAYPLLIKHILREAKHYMEHLECLQNRRMPNETICDKVNFWNEIMEEHLEFIDGLLDPTEEELKEMAEELAEAYEELENKCSPKNEMEIVEKSLDNTKKTMEFKKAGTEGLLGCKIQSIIIPLLGDHVLREANHYLRMLNMMKK